MADSDPKTVTDNALAAIGKQLAKAREAAGKDQQAVATELHLRVAIIEALEAGDEAALPAAAFIRGYVRSYARFVGLDDVALVARLPQAVEHRPVPRRVALQQSRMPSIPLGRVLVWGMVLLVLVLVLWYGIPTVERLWSGQNDYATGNTLKLPQSEPENEVLMLSESDGSESRELPEFVSEPPVEVPEVAPAVSQPPTVKKPAVALSAEPNDAMGPAELTLRFSADSWVEMKSRDRKLVMGTQRAGTERTVRAEPPIDILLGNAPAVEMTWRGKPFDITPYQRGKVARIKLEH